MFKLPWDVIGEQREIFALLPNMADSGDDYWVFAHVTASSSRAGRHVLYHSNRRVPHRGALQRGKPR